MAEDSKGVRLHSFCGKWMAGANMEMSQIDPVTGIRAIREAPVWTAYVFAPTGVVHEYGFSNQEETTAAMFRLAQKHLGWHILAPISWFNEALK